MLRLSVATLPFFQAPQYSPQPILVSEVENFSKFIECNIKVNLTTWMCWARGAIWGKRGVLRIWATSGDLSHLGEVSLAKCFWGSKVIKTLNWLSTWGQDYSTREWGPGLLGWGANYEVLLGARSTHQPAWAHSGGETILQECGDLGHLGEVLITKCFWGQGLKNCSLSTWRSCLTTGRTKQEMQA